MRRRPGASASRSASLPCRPISSARKKTSRTGPDDLDRYQTVFAARDGAIAAPTAGLHFTPEILGEIRGKGATVAEVTLNVGPATFQPVRAERLEDHRMLEETYRDFRIGGRPRSTGPRRSAGRWSRSGRRSSGRSRAPRSGAASPGAAPGPRPGRADRRQIFIYPGFDFKVVDRLLTNFHLPKSTLLMLVAAFAGRDLILAAYREAVREGYRFFSYGDCMLIR